MVKPRNTLVLVTLIEQASRKVGAIEVPTNKELYTEAEVVDIGPGNVSADGGRSETFDLKPGQRVWVKYKERRSPNPLEQPIECGIRYQQDEKTYYLFEQTSILGIIAEPGESRPVLGIVN